MKQSVITICSSADFYKKAVELQVELETYGFKVIVPVTAEKMKVNGDYDASHYRTWLNDDTQYHKKSALMRGHFEEVEKGDAILVVNEEKHGLANYIGGNVLIEMALAFYLRKPIYILNDVPKESKFLEEILAMEPVVLIGKLNKLIEDLSK